MRIVGFNGFKVVVVNISVRDVDAELYREFKAEAARQGASMGVMLTNAIRSWLDYRKKQSASKKK